MPNFWRIKKKNTDFDLFQKKKEPSNFLGQPNFFLGWYSFVLAEFTLGFTKKSNIFVFGYNFYFLNLKKKAKKTSWLTNFFSWKFFGFLKKIALKKKKAKKKKDRQLRENPRGGAKQIPIIYFIVAFVYLGDF